jgi:hypothetical protein
MALTHHYIDKIVDIQNQLLPILKILDDNDEKQFKKYILNKEMGSLSNIIHNIDNIMLEIIKLKFVCHSFCELNNRNDLSKKISLDENLINSIEIKEKINNDKENQKLINKFIPIMMYYSMMNDLNCKNENECFGPEEKDITNESEEYD